ncbi:hypothetical protein [Micromonospora sp. NPDC005806]|uniref:hypothetical protein n=1 Tax=Micromonospora sp. NPDC005806 TaxID=3364234 RepID=UPI0036CE0D09
MTEFEDILVSGEFAAFREAHAPDVRPAGPAEVRRTVRRRRRRAVIATAAVVALAVALPVAANAALQNRRAPAPAESVKPTPSERTPSPTPSATPSPTPSTVGPTAAAPNGRISRAQLLAARLDLPSWPSYTPESCTVNDVRLDPGPGIIEQPVPVLLGDPRYGDLDGDGALETVALIGCLYAEATAKQVVAFDRDESGRIITMGQVVGVSEGMEDITDFSVSADGKIRAHVADIQPCCSTPAWFPQRQWRTYTWTDTRFSQTAGPTKFRTDPRLTDLKLTAGDLVLGPADASGKRPGSVTVTVTNKGPVDVPGLGFDNFFTIGEPAGGDLSHCKMKPSDATEACVLDGLRAGASRTYTFRFQVDPEAPPGGQRSLLVIHFDAQGRYWRDLAPQNNSVVLKVTG